MKAEGLWVPRAERFPTPTASDYGTNVGGGQGRIGPVRPSLKTIARWNTWPTPQRRDGTPRGSQGKRFTNPGRSYDLPDAVDHRGSSGPLNPAWVEWLMGWPIGWTDLNPLETARFLEWLQQHGRFWRDALGWR
jgi:hypothetical protein